MSSEKVLQNVIKATEDFPKNKTDEQGVDQEVDWGEDKRAESSKGKHWRKQS